MTSIVKGDHMFDQMMAAYDDAQGVDEGPETGSLDCSEDCSICPYREECQSEEDDAL